MKVIGEQDKVHISTQHLGGKIRKTSDLSNPDSNKKDN